MDWKEFFRPTTIKVCLAVILLVTWVAYFMCVSLVTLAFIGAPTLFCQNPSSPLFLITLAVLLLFFPVMLSFYPLAYMKNSTYFILLPLIILVIESYLLASLFLWVVSKTKFPEKLTLVLGSIPLIILIFGIVLSPFFPPSYGYFKLKPNEEAGKLIVALVVNKGLIMSSGVVEFNTDKPQLFSKSIAVASKYTVSTDQICVSSGSFNEDPDVWESTSKLVTYKQSAPKKVRIQGICDTGKQLSSTLAELKREDMAIPDCECLESAETCCLLVLKKV